MNAGELIDGRRECRVYGFEVRNNGSNPGGTVGGGERSSGQWVALLALLQYFEKRSAKNETNRAHLKVDNQTLVRRP